MALIYETKNFVVDYPEKPLVSRKDGGHIRIKVKDKSITDRTKLSPDQAVEFMRLTMVVGEAFERAMNNRGIPVIKINYQDMGNWYAKDNTAPYLHMHIFGRSVDAVKQPWPEAVYLPDRKTGFYDGFEALAVEDQIEISKEIESIFKQQKYSDEMWRLS